MKLKTLFLICICCALSNISYANRIDLGDGISIEIPDSFTQNTKSNYKYSGSSEDLYICIHKRKVTYSDDSQMSKSKVLKSLDTLCFNLGDYKFISKQNEPFLSMTEDYRIKRYAKESNLVTTYTSYVKDVPYCILFQYKEDSTMVDVETQIESIIKSILFTGGIYQQGAYSFRLARNNWVILFVLFFILTVFAIKQEWSALRKIMASIPIAILFAIVVGLLTGWNTVLIIFFTPIVLIFTILMALFGWENIIKMFD